MAVARYYNHTLGEWVLLAAGRDGESGASSWDDLTDKPDTYPPETHTHTMSEVDDLEAALDGKASTDHTHEEYATSAAVEARTPKIQIVTTIPTTPTPGVVYLRFG